MVDTIAEVDIAEMTKFARGKSFNFVSFSMNGSM